MSHTIEPQSSHLESQRRAEQTVGKRLAHLGDPEFPVETAGKKAAHLHRLSLEGFPVPSGFVIPPAAEIPDEILLAREVARIGGFPVAARSSGVLEDLDGASFAGQYESYLNIANVQELRERIQECRASAFSSRAQAYLADHGMPGSGAGLTVFVQKMVDAQMAGVAFSVHPLTGLEDSALVESCDGLGDRLVSGEITPSRTVIDKRAGQITSQEIEESGGKLNAQQGAELARVLILVQASFGKPQDIEWAIDHSGKFWMLQARPITQIQWRQDIPLHSNANMREGGVATRVCLPLVYSLIGAIFGRTFDEYLHRMRLLSGSQMGSMQWMRWFYGRPYWNAAAMKQALFKIPGFNEADFERDLGLIRDYGAQGPQTTPWNARTIARAIPSLLAVMRERREGLTRLEGFKERFEFLESTFKNALSGAGTPAAQLSDAEFAAGFLVVLRDFFCWSERQYLMTGFTATDCQRECAKAVAAVARSGIEISLLKLISGLEGGVYHLAINQDLLRMVVIARRDGMQGPEWEEAKAHFIARHSFHGDAELDVSVPRWGEIPGKVETLVGALLQSEQEISDPRARHAELRADFESERERVLSELRARGFRGRLQARRLAKHIALTRAYLVKKEEMREFSTRSYAVVRAWILEAGRRLAFDEVLASADDVFYLEIGELEGHFSGADPIDAGTRAAVEYRKFTVRGFRDFDPPTEIGGMGVNRETTPLTSSAVAGVSLMGLGCSPGVVEGIARVIPTVADLAQIQSGDILVTRFTDPGWTPALGLVRGIVTEVGGLLSHAAVIGREYRIPTVLNLREATKKIRSGQRIRIDGSAGTVEILE